MAGNTHIPHIKRHTEGTSNELSFDVLDAARNELDSGGKRKKFLFGGGSKKAKKSKDPISGTATLPTSAALSTTEAAPAPKTGARHGKVSKPKETAVSALAPSDEVKRRKKARRTHNLRIWVVGVLVVGIVAAGIGFYAHRAIEEKKTFSEQFTALVDSFAGADKAIVEIDGLMPNPLDPEKAEKRAALVKQVPSLVTTLKVTQTKAETLVDSAPSSNDAVAVNQVVNAAAARVVMVQAAGAAFELSDIALKQLEEAKTTWNQATEADQIAREGISLSNQAADQDSTIYARNRLQESLNLFVEVSYRLVTLENAVEGLDLSAQRAYVDKRITALEYAVETSNSLLAGDREGAIANNDAYNAADLEAAALAETLPMSIVPSVSSLYEAKIDEFVTKYEQARAQAIESDSIVREYLGQTTK